MHVPITTASLVVLTFATLLMRIYWLRVPPIVRFCVIRGAIALVLIEILSTVTRWSTASDRANVIIAWLAVASYEMLLMLFTRLRPRWLTSLCGVILLMPVFASSVLLPLTSLFDPTKNEAVSIGNDLSYQRVPWGDRNDTSANSGVDILVSYHPPFAPFLRRYLRNIPFNNQQCNTNAAFALLGVDPKTVIVRCPHRASQQPGNDDWIIPVP
jgi:hypothetical protein